MSNFRFRFITGFASDRCQNLTWPETSSQQIIEKIRTEVRAYLGLRRAEDHGWQAETCPEGPSLPHSLGHSPALGAVSPRTEEDNPPLLQTSGPDVFFTAKYLLKIRQVFRFTIIFV